MWYYALYIFYVYLLFFRYNPPKKVSKLIIKTKDGKQLLEEFFKKKRNFNIIINLTKNSKKYISLEDLIDNITNPLAEFFDPTIYQLYLDTQNKYGVDNFNTNYKNNSLEDSIISITDSINNNYQYSYPFLNFLKWTIQYKIIYNLNDIKQG